MFSHLLEVQASREDPEKNRFASVISTLEYVQNIYHVFLRKQ